MFGRIKIHFSKDKKIYQSLHNIFGFYPGRLSYYKIALTHNSSHYHLSSKDIKINNERLEFLGDSVIGTIVTEKIYNRFPSANEGFLTEMRSKIVGRNKLNQIGRKIGLLTVLKYDIKLNNNRSISDTLCGNTLEALIGAIYLDKGYNFTKKIITKIILNNHIDFDQLLLEELSYKAKLIKWAQREHKKIDYQVYAIDTENKQNIFTIEILIDGEKVIAGRNHSKKIAEELASQKYCTQIGI